MRDEDRWNHIVLGKKVSNTFMVDIRKNGIRGFLIHSVIIHSVNYVEITDNISAPLWEVVFYLWIHQILEIH
ncbi:hypothetical protein EGI16_06880 [Chryseobacterium sp. G0240]|nr:hypothetical protein EGI16_06880 [Chryseobacterium sp. G0240]